LDKSKARFRRLQNSSAAQTLVIADLALRQDLLAKTLSMSAQINFGDNKTGMLPFKIWLENKRIK
jgi:hypothetical protein